MSLRERWSEFRGGASGQELALQALVVVVLALSLTGIAASRFAVSGDSPRASAGTPSTGTGAGGCDFAHCCASASASAAAASVVAAPASTTRGFDARERRARTDFGAERDVAMGDDSWMGFQCLTVAALPT